jgi:hypothetical protein
MCLAACPLPLRTVVAVLGKERSAAAAGLLELSEREAKRQCTAPRRVVPEATHALCATGER